MEKKYKIEVKYARVFEVEAENSHDAREKAVYKAIIDLKKDFGSGAPYSLEAREYEEPMDWEAQAKSEAVSIADDLEKEIAEKAEQWKKDNSERATDEWDEAEDDIRAMYDEMYQEEDIVNYAHEHADGYFIYTHRKGLQEAMDCADELSEYASGDSGLWEGIDDYERIIQIKGYDALDGAILHYAEEIIKERLLEAVKK